jgi:hypothetical protein
MIYISWPSDWTLDCDEIDPECVSGDGGLTCETDCIYCNVGSQRLEMNGCFDGVYVNPDSGTISFDIDGLVNPQDTA